MVRCLSNDLIFMNEHASNLFHVKCRLPEAKGDLLAYIKQYMENSDEAYLRRIVRGRSNPKYLEKGSGSFDDDSEPNSFCFLLNLRRIEKLRAEMLALLFRSLKLVFIQ